MHLLGHKETSMKKSYRSFTIRRFYSNDFYSQEFEEELRSGSGEIVLDWKIKYEMSKRDNMNILNIAEQKNQPFA